MQLHQCEKFVAVDVPKGLRLVWDDRAEISRLIELPITTLQYAHRFSSWENKEATFLHRNCDPNSSRWRLAPERWQHNVGNVLVVRDDMKELLPKHLEVLCDFCQHKLSKAFGQSWERSGLATIRMLQVFAGVEVLDPEGRAVDADEVLGEITKAKFQERFESYRAEKAKTNSEWLQVPSPYDVLDVSNSDDEDGY